MDYGLDRNEEVELRDRQRQIDIAYNSVSHKLKRNLRDLQSSIKYNLKIKTPNNDISKRTKNGNNI